MKSAYEKAMERLEQASGPGKTLTDEQRAAIAEIDKKCDARIAERKMELDPRIASAASMEEMNSLKKELAQAISDIESEREREKEAVWGAD